MTEENLLPSGWHLAGNRPARYRASLAPGALGQSPALCLAAREASTPTDGFGTVMQTSVRGTGSWERHAVVLDVPPEATQVAFGILLNGHGAVWLAEPRVEVVGPDVAVTGRGPLPAELPEHPVNMELLPAATG